MKQKLILLFLLSNLISFGQVNYKYYSKKELEEDLDFFYKKTTPVHPLLFERVYKSRWNRDYSLVERQLNDSLTQIGFYALVAPMLASLGDEHTLFTVPVEDRELYTAKGLVFPFSVKIRDNMIFVDSYHENGKKMQYKDYEIVNINGTPAEQILSDLRDYVGGNNIAIRNIAVENNFNVFLWLRYGFEEHYNLTFRPRINSNATIKASVKGITHKSFLANSNRLTLEEQNPYAFSMDKKRNMAVFAVRTFSDPLTLTSFADSVFQIIKDNNIRHLVIDVRDNMGGRSTAVDSLMNYLIDIPYQQYRKTVVRTSEELNAYYQHHQTNKQYEELKKLPLDRLVVFLGEKFEPHKKKNKFNGNLYIWTNDLNFSAGATFVGVIRKNKLGLIIGEETGGAIVYYGDNLTYTMPNTKLTFHVCPKRFMQYGNPDSDRGVVPEYEIRDIDGEIEKFTYNLIEKANNEPPATTNQLSFRSR